MATTYFLVAQNGQLLSQLLLLQFLKTPVPLLVTKEAEVREEKSGAVRSMMATYRCYAQVTAGCGRHLPELS